MNAFRSLALVLLAASVAVARPPAPPSATPPASPGPQVPSAPVAPPAPPAEGPQLSAARGNTGKRLTEIAAQLKTGQAAAAADDLRRLVADSGDELVTADGRHFRPVRRAAHAVLAQLPPAELRAVRDRADAPALELLRRGERDHDPAPLVTLVDRYFLSTHAEAALSLLGDLAFERGDFRAAETHWRRLLPADDQSPDPGVLNPTLDPARTRARVTLAVLFQGDSARSDAAFAAFQTAHPDAAGPLAGKVGRYADTLDGFRRSPPAVPATVSTDGDWPAFAGGPGRTGHAAAPLARYYPARPTWQVVVPVDARAVPAPVPGLPGFPGFPAGPGLPQVEPVEPPRGLSARQVGRHPVALGGWGFVADAAGVFGFDLKTGAARFQYRHPNAEPAAPDLDADHPMTAAPSRNLLFARLGKPTVVPVPAANPAVVVALAVPPFGSGGELEVRFTLKPPVPADTPAAWEAAPTWADGRLVAAFVREANNRLTTALACYADSGGDPVWVTDLTDAPVGGAGRVEARARPEPVTVAGDLAVFTTHAGYVCGVDVRSGKLLWAHHYPPAARPTANPRDLCPAVVDGGRVFAAPTDSDRLLCLDAVTGRLLWESTQVQIDQLLGVAAGRLVATVAAPVRGLRGYRVTSGSSREPDGWAVHDDPQLSSYGRGLVADGAVVWPTRSAVFFARPTDGLPLGPRLLGPHGNLAFAGDTLLVATPTEVWGYVRGSLPAMPPAPPAPSPAQRAADALAAAPAGGGEAARDRFRTAHGVAPADDSAVVSRPSGAPVRLGKLLAERFLTPVPPRSRAPAADLNPAPDPDPTPLGPGLAVGRVTALPTRSCFALRPFDGRPGLPGLGPDGGADPVLVVADARTLYAVRPADGKPAWACPLPAGLAVTHAHVGPDAVTAAGPGGFLTVGRADGKPRWDYCHPADAPPLGDFHAGAGVLVARAGGHHLLAFDAGTGDVLWCRDAAGRSRLGASFPFSPAFGRHVAPVAGAVLAEAGPNRRVLLDADTGERLGGSDGHPAPWRGPPARVGYGRVAVPDGPGAVRALVANGPSARVKTAWVWSAANEASLTGRLPLLRATGSGLVVAVDRNHATELDLLTLSHGERVWPAGPLLPPGECDLSGAAVTDRFLFVAVDDALHAVRLADGAPAWKAPAALPALLGCPPGGRYHVAAGPRGVAVAPTLPAQGDPFDPLAVLNAGLTGRVPVALLLQLDAWSDTFVPVAVLDPATGGIAGRVDVSPAGPAPGVHLSGARPVVVGAGAAHWLR